MKTKEEKERQTSSQKLHVLRTNSITPGNDLEVGRSG
jgi:hypothetical protein